VDDEAPRLVDHQQILILVGEVERYGLGSQSAWLGGRDFEGKPLTGFQALTGPGGSIVDPGVSLAEKPLDGGPG
jgi:hypothetical protein